MAFEKRTVKVGRFTFEVQADGHIKSMTLNRVIDYLKSYKEFLRESSRGSLMTDQAYLYDEGQNLQVHLNFVQREIQRKSPEPDTKRKYIIGYDKRDSRAFALKHKWIRTQWRHINRPQFLIGKTPQDIEVYVTCKGENSSTYELRRTCAKLGFMGGITEREIIEGPLRGTVL